ncbi:MAG TPA: DNA polymerase ligase N-terminal domain-containing protein [Baekduia sp.]|uniref:acylphosphatase n=1 Tax=Baekduia sp. TaxID=2600305 RepID=UPI002D77F2B3|nr:DNA polymerase ligase N-terminal domain-containing protein [Baekduia sp.]HET6508130.1 DNA polymerase ligase N-terminal domain-containing protein [Baekduia sp.]
MSPSGSAFRAAAAGSPDPAALRDAVIARARALELLGWARADDDGVVRVHAEGDPDALARLTAFLGERVGPDAVALDAAKREGHEQFAPRGVPAGVFVVQEHRATAHHWDFRLEVDGVMRSWAVPKGPSLDPAVKRLAVQVEDHDMSHNAYEGDTVIVWDRGTYEQGGRVPWPKAIDERGHAVFVLHGEKLNGGFALQRTGRGDAKKPQWLLVKRKDDDARPGSDVVVERPESVMTGKPLPTPGSS